MRIVKSWLALVLVFLMVCPLAARTFAANNTAPQSAAYVDANAVVYAVAAVNIRSGPGTEHPILGALQPGKCIRRLALGNNGWSKVMHQGKVAYIHSSYLTTNHPTDNGGLRREQLQTQIDGFRGLNPPEHTAQSRQAVAEAVDKCCEALNSADQQAVDDAAQALQAAMAALVPMDYAPLQAALSQIGTLGEKWTDSTLWLKLMEAEEKGKALLQSGDQAAVDAAAGEISGLVEQIRLLPEPQAEPEIIIQQVPVEVPSREEPSYITWKVLFLVSTALAVSLAGIILVYILKKRNKHRDNTPLVDYDISDDTM